MHEPSASAKAIFWDAVERTDDADRTAFLGEACGANVELRRHVEALLRVHAQPDSLLDRERIGAQVIVDAENDQDPFERVGSQIGPYKLLQEIGEGGMGVVYMAEQNEPVKRRVAIKIIKPGMDSRQVIARFEVERQALSLMDHPNIAKVLDAGTTTSGRPYFVMELVKGQPITQYCDEHCLTPHQRLELFLPVCQAIQHAHHKGIIHRDIKPTNILIAEYDERPVPKVIDFGVAKATGQALTEKTMFTGLGQIVGTLEYMSPEQAKVNQLDIDTRSDIYSLGVLMYELLTGSTPFDKHRLRTAGWDEMLRIIREEEPPKPSTRLSTFSKLRDTRPNAEQPTALSGQSARYCRLSSVAALRRIEPAQLTKLVRGELDWIVMKALEKERGRRYETASALAADLQHYLRDEPVVACPASALYRFRKFARRNSRALLTALIVAVAVVLTAGGSGVMIWQSHQDLQHALDRERRGAYFERIALAEREWGANNLSRMERLLDDCPEDLRGWEWRYLKRLRFDALPPLHQESAVYSVAFSADGQFLATARMDGKITLCRASTMQEIRSWGAHEDNATTLQFSPDSRFLATGSWDGTVKVWDVQKVEAPGSDPVHCWKHASRVWSVAFSPDGGRLASATGKEIDELGETTVWDLKTGQEKLSLDFNWAVRCVQFSPDGQRLATASGQYVKVWDAETGQELLACQDPLGTLQCVCFSPDGRRLAAVGGLLTVHPAREIKVWDAYSGQEIFSLHGHVGGLNCVTYSPDGRRLASTGLDQTVKLWDATTGQEVLTLRGHLDNIRCVTFSADGHQLASAGTDKTVRIWDAAPVEEVPNPEYATLYGHTGAVTDVVFHPTDGRTLASAGTDGSVRMWDLWSRQELVKLSGPTSAVRLRTAFSPDGESLGVVSMVQDAPLKFWNPASGKETGSIARNTGPELCLAFSPDGRHVATAGFDFVVRIWDVATGRETQVLEGHDWPIFAVAFSSDGRHLASGSGDSTVRVWDRTTGKESLVLEPRHAARVADVAFSRDGQALASVSWDRTIKVWDTATWKILHDLRDSNEAAVQCVAFGADRSRLVWGSTDGTVKIWDGPGTETHILRGHTSWVQGVAFSPDGKWIASASLDGTVKIWPAPPEPEAAALQSVVIENDAATNPEED
jgi:WD40 repeat protein/serine/threonine protein kinase